METSHQEIQHSDAQSEYDSRHWFTIADIATMLNRPQTTVRSWVVRKKVLSQRIDNGRCYVNLASARAYSQQRASNG